MAERCPITGTSLYLVLKSNGLPHSKNLPVKFGFSPKTVSANIVKKLPPQRCSKPLFIPLFNFSHKRPTFAFTGESGYTTRLLKKDRTQRLTRRNRGRFGWGWYHYSQSVPHVHEHPRAGCQNGVLCRFGILAGRCSRRTQKAFGTAMRLCVSLSRGVAAPLGCVICLQLGDVAVFSLCAQYFLNVRGGGVSLPSVRFACCRNAGRPLAKAANLPFSEVGWSLLISAAQNVLDRNSLLVIDFKYQKSIINRPTKKGGPHGRLQTGRC